MGLSSLQAQSWAAFCKYKPGSRGPILLSKGKKVQGMESLQSSSLPSRKINPEQNRWMMDWKTKEHGFHLPVADRGRHKERSRNTFPALGCPLHDGITLSSGATPSEGRASDTQAQRTGLGARRDPKNLGRNENRGMDSCLPNTCCVLSPVSGPGAGDPGYVPSTPRADSSAPPPRPSETKAAAGWRVFTKIPVLTALHPKMMASPGLLRFLFLSLRL